MKNKYPDLWNAAHPLRDSSTIGRITVGDAIAQFGRRVVADAIRLGEVTISRVEMRPAWTSGAGRRAYASPNGLVDPVPVGERPTRIGLTLDEARPEDRLCANGVQIG